MRRGRGLAFSIVAALALLVPARRAEAQRRGAILHEQIPDDPDDDRRQRVAAGVSGFSHSSKGLIPETREPDAKPSDPRLSGFDHPFVPDRDTRAPDILAGANVFDPSISPYERVAAFDAVLFDFTVGVSDSATHALQKTGIPAGADTFRARFEITLARERATRIPSVVAGSVLVDSTVTIEGRAVSHRINADAAENWYLVSGETGIAVVRLTIAAPRAAFGGAFGNPDWAALPRIRELPEVPRRSAAIVLERLGLSRRDPPARAVEKLTHYFREFRDSKDPPEAQSDIYRDIALSKKGVCRHRAYAFLVTATALGLPTRLVMNSQHAWVEVHNGVLFKRIDLGGGGTIVNPEKNDVASYREPPDPFTWPAGASSGRDTMQRGRSGGGGGGGTNGGGKVDAAGSASASSSASARPVPSGLPPDPLQQASGPRSTVTLSSSQKDVLRGNALDASGDVRAGDHACAFVGVDLSLVSNAGPSRTVPLGALPSDALGHFSGTLRVPSSIALGEYHLVAKTRGGKGCGPGGSP